MTTMIVDDSFNFNSVMQATLNALYAEGVITEEQRDEFTETHMVVTVSKRKNLFDLLCNLIGTTKANDADQNTEYLTVARCPIATRNRLANVKKAGRDVSYTVQSGDTLSDIALHFYGDASRYKEIHAANLGIIHDANEIRVGQVITVPNVTRT